MSHVLIYKFSGRGVLNAKKYLRENFRSINLVQGLTTTGLLILVCVY